MVFARIVQAVQEAEPVPIPFRDLVKDAVEYKMAKY